MMLEMNEVIEKVEVTIKEIADLIRFNAGLEDVRILIAILAKIADGKFPLEEIRAELRLHGIDC